MRGFLNHIKGVAARGAGAWPLTVLAGLSLMVVIVSLTAVMMLQRDAADAARQLGGDGWQNGAPPALIAMRQAQSSLGYEGFLGDLQRFIATPSLQGAGDMRAALSQAQQAVMTLGTFADSNSTTTDMRLPMWQAVLTLYQQALSRAEQSLGTGQSPDPSLFMPLYAAQQSLAALSAQTEGALRAHALTTLQDDNDALRHLVWFVLAASILLVIASWLTLNGAYQKPLETLATALAGPGRLNAKMPMWGTDRMDAIGTVARAAEALRQQLLTIPDISITDANGDTRFMNFGGTGDHSAKATFDVLIARLSLAANAMQAADVPTTLENVEALCRALANTVQLTYDDLARASTAIEATSTALATSGATHDARLAELTGTLEARTATVAEIAQLTGTQVQTSLKDIVGAQLQLRMAANQGAAMFTQYGATVEDMSERMAAATGLLRSGGKVLQETVDSVRTRMMDATSALTQTDARLSAVIEENRQRLEELAQQAQTVLARGGEGQAALSELTAASERIVAVATRLAGAESDLTKATQTINAQSGAFAPLATQLEALHRQLAEQVGQQLTQQISAHTQAIDATAERQNAAIQQLNEQAQRMGAAANALQDTNFAPIMGKLEGLAQLTDGLSSLLGEMQQIAPQLASFNSETLQGLPTMLAGFGDKLSGIDLSVIGEVKETLTTSTAATEMNALRLNANLQLVQTQITDLLANLSGGQAQLLPHIETMQRALIQLRQQRSTDIAEMEAVVGSAISGAIDGALDKIVDKLPQPIAPVAAEPIVITAPVDDTTGPLIQQLVDELNQKIDAQYQNFTGSLTGFITKFEQALATPVTVSGEEATVPSSALAILNRLRGGEAAAPATAETTLKDAIGRVTQIKKLTGALATQTRALTEIALGTTLSDDPRKLAEQAKTLITEVMDAISELSNAAETITETADRLNSTAH